MLLDKIVDRLLLGVLLTNTKWQNAEAEAIVEQTLVGCRNNLHNHKDAFSWLKQSAISGTNKTALGALVADGSLVVETYQGLLTPPDGVETVKGLPQILRVTDSLLQYVDDYLTRKEQKCKK